jgi:proteasome lid subunit RPN8/RPN11
VKIGAEHVLAIEDHARRGYPDEVCGVLVGQRAAEVGVEAVVPVANREREAPRVRYQIAPEDLLRIQRESRESRRDIVGFYHSHPDHPARPSETDRRIAAEGLSDGVVHVVVSVDGAGRTVPSGWVFRDATQAFEDEPLAVVGRRGEQEEEDGCRSRS